MKVYQSRSFEKRVKRFSESEKIMQNPSVGEEKKGDLRGVYVYKFRIKTLQYLLSYRMVENDLELIMIGPHENYYRDLKSYLKRK